LHLAILEAGTQPKVWHITNRSGSWSAPSLVCTLNPDVPFTGFDIETTERYVWIVAAQEQLVTLRRFPLS
jgi:hypothetical protein